MTMGVTTCAERLLEMQLFSCVCAFCTAVGLVRVVLAVVVSVADVGRVGADPRAALELTRPAFEFG